MAQKKPRRPAASSPRDSRRPPQKGSRSASGRRPDADLRSLSRELREFAMGLPGATEDFPWGERVAKVNGKVFVFLGIDPVPGGPMGLSIKLPVSGEEALDLPFAEPTGYGLGKSGWVSARFEPGDHPPIEILKAWILESYRAIAPKKRLAELEGPASRPRSSGSASGRG